MSRGERSRDFLWLFLLGWARIVTGHFSPIDIAMTIIVGFACAIGISISLRWSTAVSAGRAGGAVAFSALLQLAALRVSFIPYIATR